MILYVRVFGGIHVWTTGNSLTFLLVKQHYRKHSGPNTLQTSQQQRKYTVYHRFISSIYLVQSSNILIFTLYTYKSTHPNTSIYIYTYIIIIYIIIYIYTYIPAIYIYIRCIIISNWSWSPEALNWSGLPRMILTIWTASVFGPKNPLKMMVLSPKIMGYSH